MRMFILVKCLDLLLFYSPAAGAELFEKVAKKTGIEAQLLRSIASVESQNGLYKLNPRTMDVGLMQINYKTAHRYDLSLTRLYTDDVYSVQAAAIILTDLKRMFGRKEPATWPCRYNVGTGSMSVVGNNCAIYLDKLQESGYTIAIGDN